MVYKRVNKRGKTLILPVELLNNFSVLFQVSIPFTYGTVVQPIAMTHSQPVAGSLAVVSGWGAVSAGGPYSMQLQAVEIYIVSREECNSAYADYGGITGYMICAGVTGGGKGPCQGDSGGPLVVGGQLVGIVSWGYGCAEFAYPGVYSDVASLRSFVTDTTGVQ
jgi:trypsin